MESHSVLRFTVSVLTHVRVHMERYKVTCERESMAGIITQTHLSHCSSSSSSTFSSFPEYPCCLSVPTKCSLGHTPWMETLPEGQGAGVDMLLDGLREPSLKGSAQLPPRPTLSSLLGLIQGSCVDLSFVPGSMHGLQGL